jgi:cytochrome c-type biogenesis protein CcmF
MPETSALNFPESPVALLGTITLLIAFLVAAYSATAGIIGNLKERRRLVSSSVYSLYAFFGLMMLASALMIYAFISHDYSIKYVYRYSDTSMPIYYKITAYWGGLDGSLMFWVSVLAVFSAIAIRANAHRHRDMIGYVVAVIMLVQLFFLALLVYNKNPFATFLTEAPPDGKGLNPLLQNYWMVIHPPSLYIGYVAATIPFAFAIGALASGRLDDRWLSSVRSWTLICWFFLSFGLILGGRWAYEELGWGGYWAWDPVENAGLLPWFTATAFLHAVIIQEQRGMMKTWNMVLVITTFFLTIFGTFMTRSGVVQSVHAFGEDNALALLFILFMAAILIGSFGLLVYRLPRLRSTATFESYLSREYAFLLNNWILLGCALFVLFATMFPTLSEAVNGQRITVGPPFFNRIMIPLGLILLFLAGAAPLLAYRRTTRDRLWSQFAVPVAVCVAVIAGLAITVPRTLTLSEIIVKGLKAPVSLLCFGLVAFTLACVGQEFWRGTRVRMKQTDGTAGTSLVGLILAKRRKYGGYLIHASMAVMFFGFAGKAYEAMTDFTVDAGETFSERGYTFYFHDLYVSDDDHKRAVTARVALYDGPIDVGGKVAFGREDVDGIGGEFLSTLYPAKWQYKKSEEQPTTEVDMVNYIEEDVYIILTGYNEQSQTANFRVYINPLVNWVWLGFFLLMVGTIICLIPGSWVETVKPPRKTRSGRVVETALVLLTLGGIVAGGASIAAAQAPGEYSDRPAHDVSAGAAHMFQPGDPSFDQRFVEEASERVRKARPDLDPSSAEFAAAVDAELEPVRKLAHRLYTDIVCLCGCPKETLRECRCGNAAAEREIALKQMVAYDLFDPAERERAYDDITEEFVARHGDQHVLREPKNLKGANKFTVWLPYLALIGALLFIILMGRRWVGRGRRKVAEAGGSKIDEADQDYIDALEDELADID